MLPELFFLVHAGFSTMSRIIRPRYTAGDSTSGRDRVVSVIVHDAPGESSVYQPRVLTMAINVGTHYTRRTEGYRPMSALRSTDVVFHNPDSDAAFLARATVLNTPNCR